MVKPRLLRFAATAAVGGTKVENQDLPHGSVLTHITLGYDAASNKPPVRAFAGLEVGGIHAKLAGGWVRSQAVPTHEKDPSWDGRIEVPDQATLRFVIENFTGAEQTIYCYYTTEPLR